jgi:hypothetical protein
VSIPLFKPSEQGSKIHFLGSKIEDRADRAEGRAPKGAGGARMSAIQRSRATGVHSLIAWRTSGSRMDLVDSAGARDPCIQGHSRQGSLLLFWGPIRGACHYLPVLCAQRGRLGSESHRRRAFAAIEPTAAPDPSVEGTKGAKIFDPLGASEEAQALYLGHSNPARRCSFLGSKMEGRACEIGSVRSHGFDGREAASRPFYTFSAPGLHLGMAYLLRRARWASLLFWGRSDCGCVSR